MDEIFLEDEETGFLVSNIGRVIGKSGIELKQKTTRRGYLNVAYYKSGIQKFVLVHRLVARNFIPNPLNLPQVNHKDEDKKNNKVDNLEWCSRKYNSNFGTSISRMKITKRENGITTSVVLTNGVECKRFNAIVDAEKELNLRKGSVSALLRGHQYVLRNGWHLIGVDISKIKGRPKQIKLVNGDEIKVFSSLNEAARVIGTPHSNIRKLIKNRLKSIKGWHLQNVDLSKRKRLPYAKHIKIVKKGEVREYGSITAASKDIGCSVTSMSDMINRKIKTCFGWSPVCP